MQPAQIEVLHGIVNETTQALFASYGFECQAAPGSCSGGELATALGFTADELSGSLSLATAAGVARTLVEGTPGATEVEDWMGELTNQLFGHLQRRLLRHGVALSGGLPVVVQGEALSVLDRAIPATVATPNRERVNVDRAVDVAGGTVRVRVTLELGAQFVFQSSGSPADECPAEGDPILF